MKWYPKGQVSTDRVGGLKCPSCKTKMRTKPKHARFAFDKNDYLVEVKDKEG